MSYIERKTLLEIAEQQGHVTVDDIINEPAADAAPVRYGEWIADDYAYNRCSVCGWEWDDREYVTPYCPNCGAKMDLEDNQ